MGRQPGTPALDRERETAAVELCGCVQGLIDTNSVPDYMVDFLEARLSRFRRAHGLGPRPQKVTVANTSFGVAR